MGVKYLDSAGVTHLYSKVKTLVQDNKDIITIDLTNISETSILLTDYLTKDGIYKVKQAVSEVTTYWNSTKSVAGPSLHNGTIILCMGLGYTNNYTYVYDTINKPKIWKVVYNSSKAITSATSTSIALETDIEHYTLPIASKTRLGGVKIGTGLNIDSSGVISVAKGDSGAKEIEIKESAPTDPNTVLWINPETDICQPGESTGGVSPVGTIAEYAGTTDPDGWMICDGREISREQYPLLFKVIGTTYGSGNGSTTFNIPNLKGKTTYGYDSSNANFNGMGKTGGEITHKLTVNEMPSHSHRIGFDQMWEFGGKTSIATTKGGPYGGDGYINNTGGDQPHNNMPPYVVVNYIIKTVRTVLVGGGSGGAEEIAVGGTTPTEEDIKLWIEDDDLDTLGSEVVNSLDGQETTKAPSVKAVNDKLQHTAITFGIDNDSPTYTIASADGDVDISLNTILTSMNIDNKLIVDKTAHTITIGKGVHHVMVSATIPIYRGTSGYITIYLMYNNAVHGIGRCKFEDWNTETPSISPKLFTVKEGDVFKIRFGGSAAATYTGAYGRAGTYLTIDVLD